MFANSPFETKTATEREFIKRLLDQVGNIGPILVSVTTAVFFTMLLVTANTMAQSVRERTNEIGVLKTLGFSGQSILTLVLLEVAVADIHAADSSDSCSHGSWRTAHRRRHQGLLPRHSSIGAEHIHRRPRC